jgi:hypothetical protein
MSAEELDLTKVRYLVVFGTKVKRKIRHIARWHEDGHWIPICNAHYTARHDLQERQVREPIGVELSYPVCKRCQAWWKPEMTV